MDLTLSDDQRALADAAARMLSQHSPLAALDATTATTLGYEPGLLDRMTAMGWIDLAMERDTLVELGLVLTAIGNNLVPSPFFATVAAVIAVARLGGPDDIDHLQKRLSQRSPATLVDTARHASRVVGAETSNNLVAFAEWGEQAGTVVAIIDVAQGCVPAVLDASAADIRSVAVFDHERVARITLARPPDVERPAIRSAAEVMTVRRLLGTLRCAEMLGCAERSLEMAVAHVRQRTQFGRAIGSFQAVQHTAADMVTDLDASRLLIFNALWRASAGLPFDRHAAMATWFTGQAVERVTRAAHQIHGGTGVIREYPLHHFYRHAKAQQLRLGSRSEQTRNLADVVLADADRDFLADFVHWPVATA